MDGRRAELLADIDAWVEAARRLAALLAENTAAVQEGRSLVAGGEGFVDAVGTMSTAARFLAMNAVLEEFELARFRLRSSLISAALAEGLTGEQLAANLGVPAELAGRMLEQLRTGSDPPST
jgi:hypothetical protein